MSAAPHLSHAIESFATFLRVERNLAPRTRKAYGEDLMRFAAWCAELLKREKVPVDAILPEHLHAYLAHLRDDRGHKATTMNRCVASLKVFFEFCAQEKLLKANPAEDLFRPKLAKRLPVYLVPDELRRLFDAPDASTPAGRRDRAILVTLAYCGLRLQELVGLNTLHLDFARRTILVYGKGRKERLVPMNEEVEAVLKTMLDDPERVVADDERAVFLNARGRRMSGRAVEYIVDKHVAAAGIPKDRISPHKLRHTFATLLHSENVELVDIQSLMGHASLVSTQIYTHTNVARLKGTVELLDFED